MILFNLITRLFTLPSEQTTLENFITSKRPTNGAEVDHWIRYYYDNKSRILL
jgi:hypothetical protein